MENCLRCTEPLGPADYKVHVKCQECDFCGCMVQLEIVEREIRRGETVCHKPCEDKHNAEEHKRMEEEFKHKPVMITQQHLDYLNRINLMFAANLDLSVETNQKEASLQTGLWVVNMDIEQLYMTLKRMEAITAMVSIAVSRDKNKAISLIKQREDDKFREVKEYREKQETKKTEKTEKIAPTGEKKPRITGETPQAKAIRKMVESYKLMGLNDAQIQEILAAGAIKKGGQVNA